MRQTLVSLLLTCCAMLASAALGLDDAKQAGLVGEDASGYLAAVADRPNAEVQALVADVNAKRRAEYERIAGENGIAVEDVERLAGKKAIEKTVPGQYVRLPGEAWRKK